MGGEVFSARPTRGQMPTRSLLVLLAATLLALVALALAALARAPTTSTPAASRTAPPHRPTAGRRSQARGLDVRRDDVRSRRTSTDRRRFGHGDDPAGCRGGVECSTRPPARRSERSQSGDMRSAFRSPDRHAAALARLLLRVRPLALRSGRRSGGRNCVSHSDPARRSGNCGRSDRSSRSTPADAYERARAAPSDGSQARCWRCRRRIVRSCVRRTDGRAAQLQLFAGSHHADGRSRASRSSGIALSADVPRCRLALASGFRSGAHDRRRGSRLTRLAETVAIVDGVAQAPTRVAVAHVGCRTWFSCRCPRARTRLLDFDTLELRAMARMQLQIRRARGRGGQSTTRSRRSSIAVTVGNSRRPVCPPAIAAAAALADTRPDSRVAQGVVLGEVAGGAADVAVWGAGGGRGCVDGCRRACRSRMRPCSVSERAIGVDERAQSGAALRTDAKGRFSYRAGGGSESGDRGLATGAAWRG